MKTSTNTAALQPGKNRLFYIALLFLVSLTGYSPASHALDPGCPANDDIFTALPYEPDKLSNIIPLGDVDDDGHILPVHHLYYDTLYDEQSQEYIDTNVYSPGTMMLVAVERVPAKDFTLHMYYRDGETVCKQIRMYMNHLEVLDEDLFNIVLATGIEIPANESPTGNDFWVGLNIPLEPGTLLGRSGGITPNLDIGLIDRRNGMVGYVRPERYDPLPVIELLGPQYPELAPYALDIMPDRNYQVCAVDYYVANLKADQEQMFMDFLTLEPATGDPICHHHMQDVANTAAGNWFKDPNQSQLVMDEKEAIALVPFNIHPDQTEILNIGVSVDPIKLPGGTFKFTPWGPGSLTNPSFKDVVPGKTYCYSELIGPGGNPVSGIYILEVQPNGMELKIEYVENSICRFNNGNWPFSGNAVTVYR